MSMNCGQRYVTKRKAGCVMAVKLLPFLTYCSSGSKGKAGQVAARAALLNSCSNYGISKGLGRSYWGRLAPTGMRCLHKGTAAIVPQSYKERWFNIMPE